MNRCRSLLANVCRALAGHGIGTWLPDLPGTGESSRPLDAIAWEDWQRAVDGAIAMIGEESGTSPSIVAIRGGALLDRPLSRPTLRLAPTSGRSLLSDLRRSALASGSDPAHPAGYTLSPALSAALAIAEPSAEGTIRTLRLIADDRPADRRIDGQPLWRRPEPETDAGTEQALANEILAWAAP